jgi:histidyl-tRNA synthetase
MKEINNEQTYKGTRIIIGNEKRQIINKMIDFLIPQGFTEIQLPIINLYNTFKEKVGEENNNMMYRFKDRGERDLCLAPEYTSLVQKLSETEFKYQKDVKLFYVVECFRGENKSLKRWRQFTQFGIEILNPSKPYKGYYDNYLITLSSELIGLYSKEIYEGLKVNEGVKRGLDFYEEGEGFELVYEPFESAKQICGGGSYKGGVGAGIGLDRIIF